MEIIDWLGEGAVGIILGLFPAWWWCSALVINAVVNERKQVNKWLNKLASTSPLFILLDIGIHRKRFYLYLLKGLSIVWVVGAVVLAQYRIFYDYPNVDINRLILVETSFLPILLLTVILPVFFLKRYLSKVKSTTN